MTYYVRTEEGAKPITRWQYQSSILGGAKIVHATSAFTMINSLR